MMQVRSREPLTTMWYAEDAVRHVTASVWPSSAYDITRHGRRNGIKKRKHLNMQDFLVSLAFGEIKEINVCAE